VRLRFAILLSHPIQHFAPWHRELARLGNLDMRVFFYCNWGAAQEFIDPGFQVPVKWDVPLLDGYPHEFLPSAERSVPIDQAGFWRVDNPEIGDILSKFGPDVVQIFGYAYRSNWRVAAWTRRHRKPLLLYSDSNIKYRKGGWKGAAKAALVGHFYRQVDGALYVGDNNRAYHRSYGVPEERLFPGSLPIDRTRLLSAVPDRSRARAAVRERHGIPAEAFVLLFCGKYSSRKRPLDLVAAAHAAYSNGAPIWAIVVGEGPERKGLENFCLTHGVRNVVLTGFVNQSALPDYYASADALAITSDYDPHPLVVSEAACFGLPILASDRIGCIGGNDTARPDVNTIVFPCGDRDRLREAILSIYGDRDLYARLSAASTEIGAGQDAAIAAQQLSAAVTRLHELGPRR
jgi:glycosyltransferase involved in cell wall biosynthesis